MTIYDRITDELDKKKKTRKELCIETGISYHTLTSLFHRQSKHMKLETIRKIADYLNVSIEYLISGKTQMLLSREEVEHLYGENHDELNRELCRILSKMSVKYKTLLLAKAYELEEKEKNEELKK